MYSMIAWFCFLSPFSFFCFCFLGVEQVWGSSRIDGYNHRLMFILYIFLALWCLLLKSAIFFCFVLCHHFALRKYLQSFAFFPMSDFSLSGNLNKVFSFDKVILRNLVSLWTVSESKLSFALFSDCVVITVIFKWLSKNQYQHTPTKHNQSKHRDEPFSLPSN